MFSKQTILVTGATSGIGLAIAEQLLVRGARVIALGRNEQALLSAGIRHKVNFIHADLSRLTSLSEFFDDSADTLDGIFHCAGLQYDYDLLSSTSAPQFIEEQLRVNLLAPMLLDAYLASKLSQKSSPFIAYLSSSLRFFPAERREVYSASKAGLHSYLQGLAYQLASTPIQLFEITPTVVDTPMTAGRAQSSKISAQAFAQQVLSRMAAGEREIYVGPAKNLPWLARLAPAWLQSKLRKS